MFHLQGYGLKLFCRDNKNMNYWNFTKYDIAKPYTKKNDYEQKRSDGSIYSSKNGLNIVVEQHFILIR